MESRWDNPAPERIVRAKRGRGREGEPIEWTGWAASLECETEASPGLGKHDSWDEFEQSDGSHCPPGRPEKPLARCLFCPYRTPTPVGRGNPPQVNERTSVKELGKLTPYLRKKGCPSSLVSCGQGARGPQETGSSDCLAKTQVSANAQADV